MAGVESWSNRCFSFLGRRPEKEENCSRGAWSHAIWGSAGTRQATSKLRTVARQTCRFVGETAKPRRALEQVAWSLQTNAKRRDQGAQEKWVDFSKVQRSSRQHMVSWMSNSCFCWRNLVAKLKSTRNWNLKPSFSFSLNNSELVKCWKSKKDEDACDIWLKMLQSPAV